MKKLLLLLIIPLINFGQTKKQRIEILKFQKDSLKNILTQERIKINTLEGSIDSLLKIEKENIALLADYKEGLVFANNNIDSLRNTLSQERLKINNLKHSTDSLLKIEKEYSIALNNCETALEFANNTIDSLKIDFKKELEQTQWELDKKESSLKKVSMKNDSLKLQILENSFELNNFQLAEISWEKKNALLQNKLDSVRLTSENKKNSSNSITMNSKKQYFSTTKTKNNNYNYYSEIDYDYYWNGLDYNVIGWSNDGLFAYVESEHGDGLWWCSIEIVILDLKTDKLVDSIFIGGGSEEDPGFTGDECDLEYIWKNEYRSINSFLKKYNIKDGTIRKIILDDKINTVDYEREKSFKIKLTTDLIQKWSWNGNCDEPEKNQLNLKVIHNNKSKVVSREVVNGSVIVKGYFLSPFEDRVCIVLKYKKDGCGEYSHTSGLYFYGCSLNPKTFK